MNKKTGASIGIILGLVLISIFILFSQGFTISSLSGKPSVVYVPSDGTISCSQTRIEYYPSGDALNIQFEAVPNSAKSYWCNDKTLSNSYFARGCEVYLESKGVFDRTIKVCNDEGTTCRTLSSTESTNTWTTGTKSLRLNYNEKIYISEKGLLFSTDYKIRMTAPVYGIRIEGVGVKPSYSSNCNLQSLLSDNQIAILKNDADYSKILATSQISEGIFPEVFITGYTQSYKDTRIIEKNNIWYFVEDIGYICTIEQGSDNLYYVSDNCKQDSSVECYPGIGNCNENGKLSATQSTSCVPGTLIGSTGGRKNVYGDQACYLRCNEKGVAELQDCTMISKCSSGYTWNQNYECIKTEDANAKSICEANNGVWVTKKDESSYCDKTVQDLSTIYIILGFVVALLVILIVSMYRKRK